MAANEPFAYSQGDIDLRMFGWMRGPMLLVYGLLALYALEIVLPLLVLAIAFATRRARRAIVRVI